MCYNERVKRATITEFNPVLGISNDRQLARLHSTGFYLLALEAT